MINDECISAGERLIVAIKNKTIVKDHRPNTGKDFHGGYEEVYLHKFKKYQSSVGRFILNMKLTEEPYNG